jgi:hypothetical protein
MSGKEYNLMAFKLDNELLEELGLADLSVDDKQSMLRQILETLEMRVGTSLASKMSDAQLDEFEQLMPTEGDSQEAIHQKEQHALVWLENNFPNYKQVVNDELEKLKAEIKQTAPQIVASSQQNATPSDQGQAIDSKSDMPSAIPQPADTTFPFQHPSDVSPSASTSNSDYTDPSNGVPSQSLTPPSE